MVVAALSDVFDGYFARKFKVTSRLGAYADPLTDKVYYIATFPTLVYLAALLGQKLHAQVLLGLTVLFLLRDQWVSFLRSIGALHQVDGRANWAGKARTVIALPVICTIYYHLQAPRHWWLHVHPVVVFGLEALTLVITLISVWVYTAKYWPWVKRELRPPEEGSDSGEPPT